MCVFEALRGCAERKLIEREIDSLLRSVSNFPCCAPLGAPAELQKQ